MHELAITESVVSAVTEQVGTARVTRVLLEIGEISGVVPDAVRFAFDLCVAGTALEGATLEIEAVPGRGWCPACEQEVELHDLMPICRCGGTGVEIVAGQELRIREVEVV